MYSAVFVTRIYKEAGVFGTIPVHSTELTPRDLYQLKIFATKWNWPKECDASHPQYPTCQISGRRESSSLLRVRGSTSANMVRSHVRSVADVIDMPRDKFNTIEPFPHMFERCGALPKEYVRRPPQC